MNNTHEFETVIHAPKGLQIPTAGLVNHRVRVTIVDLGVAMPPPKCPFCGRELTTREYDVGVWGVGCDTCLWGSRSFPTEAGARIWANQRPADE